MFTKFREHADHRAKLEALNRSLATIEFSPDGTIQNANAKFLAAVGYERAEVVGKRHRMFMDPAEAGSTTYTAFWQSLRDGKFQAAEFRRLAKGGREVWIQATYNPILDGAGKTVKVMKFATDITKQKLRNADYEGQIGAINKAQAVIHFALDGTIMDANTNFLTTVGYPSTRACSGKGVVGPKRALHVQTWTCDACGVTHERDANAAQSILAAGHAVRAGSDPRRSPAEGTSDASG